MLPENMDIVASNASPRVGNVSSSHFPMDKDYVLAELDDNKPDIVLLCGNEAQKAYYLVFKWAKDVGRDVAVIQAPHPAWRALSTEKMKKIKIALERTQHNG